MSEHTHVWKPFLNGAQCSGCPAIMYPNDMISRLNALETALKDAEAESMRLVDTIEGQAVDYLKIITKLQKREAGLREEITLEILLKISSIVWDFGATYFTDSPMNQLAQKLQSLVNEAQALKEVEEASDE